MSKTRSSSVASSTSNNSAYSGLSGLSNLSGLSGLYSDNLSTTKSTSPTKSTYTTTLSKPTIPFTATLKSPTTYKSLLQPSKYAPSTPTTTKTTTIPTPGYKTLTRSSSNSSLSSDSSSYSEYIDIYSLQQQPQQQPFHGFSVYIDSSFKFNSKDRHKYQTIIKDLGGHVSLILNNKTTHFVAPIPTQLLHGFSLFQRNPIQHPHPLLPTPNNNTNNNDSTNSTNNSTTNSTITPQISSSLLYQLNNAIKLGLYITSLDFLIESFSTLAVAESHAMILEDVITVPNVIDMIFERQKNEEEEEESEEEDEKSEEDDADDTSVVSPTKPQLPTQVTPTGVLPKIRVWPELPPAGTPFSPTDFVEGKEALACKLMSAVAAPHKARWSFEEDRFYNFYSVPELMTTKDRDKCLDIPDTSTYPSGLVWAWGNGLRGQLGTDDDLEIGVPEFIMSTYGDESIVQLACGEEHSVALTDGGQVWVWGENSCGRLGNYDDGRLTAPDLVEGLSEINVIMVAAGKAHTAALTETGHLYTWGSNRFNELGYETYNSNFMTYPRGVDALSDTKMCFVACGGINTASLDECGNVYCWGSNLRGQLGVRAGKKRDITTPIQFPLDNGSYPKMKFVSVGYHYMAAIDLQGQLWAWGHNNHGQLGNGRVQDTHVPQKIIVGGGKQVSYVSCGFYHTACITVDGTVYIWGWGGNIGLLGLGPDIQQTTTPRRVDLIPSDVQQIVCGMTHTVAITRTNGKVWVWGAPGSVLSDSMISEEYFTLADIGVDDVDDDVEDDEDDESFEMYEYYGSDDYYAQDFEKYYTPQVLPWVSGAVMMATGCVQRALRKPHHNLVLIREGAVPLQFAKDGNEFALSLWLESEMKSLGIDQKSDMAEHLAKNVRDKEFNRNYSLLHLAAIRAKEDVLYLLCDSKWLHPDITDDDGNTAVHLCAEKGNPVCARILLDIGKANPDCQNKEGKTPLHLAAENEHFDVIMAMTKNSVTDKSLVDNEGNTPLHIAIKLKDFEVARYLILNAAATHILDKSGKTPFDYLSLKEANYFKSIALKNDVFISYAHVDLKFATKLKEHLEKYSIKCWMDLTRLEAGNDWRLDIGNGLLASRIVVFVVARASVVSDWCMKELHMARKEGIPILPIVHQQVDMDAEVESLIFGKKLISFVDETKFDLAGAELAKSIKSVLHIAKRSKVHKYNTIPELTLQQMWKVSFMCIMIESYEHMEEGYALENALRKSGIFTYTHSLLDRIQSEHLSKNTNMCWGFILLMKNVKDCEAAMKKWSDFANSKSKRVYICMMSSSQNQTADMADLQHHRTDSVVPVFYLQDETSVQQLVYFIQLHQREAFLEKNVTSLETKLKDVTNQTKQKEDELNDLQKRFAITII